MTINTILFDLDGLLIESEKAHFAALEDLLSKYGKETPAEWFQPMIGMDNDESASFIIKETGLPFSINELNDIRFDHIINLLPQITEPKDGLMDLMQTCQQLNLKMGVASNSPPKYVHAALHALNIHDKFGVIRTAYDVPEGKPAPDVFLEAARQLNAVPAESIGVEDSLLGLQAVIAAGMTSVAVPNQYLSAANFRDADHVFTSLAEFNKHLPELINH